MANHYPLVSNSNTLTIEELPVGDTLLVDNLSVTGNLNVDGNINANLGNVTVENLTVEGTSNLGPAGNVKISGGSNNYVLRTDGSGNLSWANIQGEIANAAGSNTFVQYNNNGLFGASANFTFNSGTNVLTVTGTANISTINTSSATLGAVANVHISGGTAGQLLATDGAGNLTWVSDPNVPNAGDGGNADSELRLLAALDGGYANSVYT